MIDHSQQPRKKIQKPYQLFQLETVGQSLGNLVSSEQPWVQRLAAKYTDMGYRRL